MLFIFYPYWLIHYVNYLITIDVLSQLFDLLCRHRDGYMVDGNPNFSAQTVNFNVDLNFIFNYTVFERALSLTLRTL